jgi:flavin reductase (DIM6/NTAB) family NADH-FMN oxidoreductase RutF
MLSGWLFPLRGRSARSHEPARTVVFEEITIDIDLASLPWEEAYRFAIGSVVPRPIAWVSSTSAAGIHNIAPFSFFNVFGAAPLILGFAPMTPDDRVRKDTLENVVALGEFVINIATEATLERMDATGRPYPPDVDEFAVAGLTPLPSVKVRAPRIAESPINFECVLHQLVPLGTGAGAATLVLGRAVHLHVDEGVLRNGRVDPALLRPVARMGGPLYARPEILPFRRSGRT